MKKRNLETICIHGGWKPRKGEPQQLPIYQSTTFRYETSDQMARLFDLKDSGYFYTRLANPTNDAVAQKIAALEGGVGAVLTSSGQAANFYAIFNICQAGDHFITSNTIYGGTFNLFGVTLKKLGIECTFIDPDWDDERIEAAFRPNTKCFFEPGRQCVRHRALCQDGAQAWCASHRGQYVRHTHQLPSVRVGLRHRDALHDEVHGRPRHSGWRCCGR